MTIQLGALAKPLKKQVGFDSKQIDVLQRCCDAVLLLKIRGYLGNSEAVRAERRIVKDIARAVEEHEKSKRAEAGNEL